MPPRRDGRWRDPGWVLLLAPLWAALIWNARTSELDDALIYLRYVRNFLDHHELVYNLGERFNGLTSPLWTYVSVILVAASGHPLFAINLASGCLLLVAMAVLYAVIADAAGRLAGAFAVAFVSSCNFFFACFGMETSIFLALCAVSLRLYLRERLGAAAITLGLLAITRSEGFFLIAAIALDMARRRPRPTLARLTRLGIPVVAPTLAVMAFNRIYYGSASPHTAMTKFEQGFSGYWGAWPTAFLDVSDHVTWFFGDQSWLCVVVMALAALGIWRQRGTALSRVLLPFLAIHLALFVLLNVPNYHWYYAVFYFFGLAYAGVGCAAVVERAALIRGSRERVASIAVAWGLVLATWLGLVRPSLDDLVDPPGPAQEYVAAGRFLATHTPPGATVAAAEIGTLGWYSERPIIDIMGLVTPINSRAIARRDLFSWLERSRPQYVVVHEPAWPFEAAAVRAERRGEYAAVQHFDVAGLRLLRRRTP